MKDDALDKFLSDVEYKSDYKSSREESLRESVRRARRSDTPLEGAGGGDPQYEERFTQSISDLDVDEEILLFKDGLITFLETYNICSEDFKRIIADASLSDNLSGLIKKYKYTFIKNLENVESHINKYSLIFSENSLIKKAKKDYNEIFSGFEEENKLNFLKIKEIFLRLREFNSLVKREWEELSTNISVINLVSEGKSLYQDLYNIVDKGLGLCTKIEKFLKFLTSILSLADDNVIDKEIFNKIAYHDGFSYKYEDLFKTEEAASVSEAPGTGTLTPKESEDGSGAGEYIGGAITGEDKLTEDISVSESLTGEPSHDEFTHGDYEPVVEFTVKGTARWNTKEPYVININGRSLENDYHDLGISVFFIDESADLTQIDREVKVALLRYLKGVTSNIISDYKDFLLRTLKQKVDELSKFFDYSGNRFWHFLYHLGPLSIYLILINEFKSNKTGSCYKHMGKNRVKSFIPYEFIKETVLNWFEENVNVHEVNADNIQEYNELRKNISKIYYAEVKRVDSVIDEVIKKQRLKNNKNVNKSKLFKIKWNKWFGIANIVVYNRFLERTIFK